MSPFENTGWQVLRWSIVSFGICIMFGALAIYLHKRTGVDYSFLYRDANAISENPCYYGILEGLTATLMISSGSILVFTAATEKWNGLGPFLFSFFIGLLTVVMGLDDLLTLHESVWFIHWRLSEIHVYLAYAATLFFSIAFNWRFFLLTPFPLLILALAALAVAGLEDVLEAGFNVEDYLEIVGFSFWFSYVVSTSVFLRHEQGPHRPISRSLPL